MEKTLFQLEYSPIRLKENAMPVIIAAAGSFTRMEGAHKQFAELGGIPVIVRTVLAFQNSPFISRVILVARKEDLLEMQGLCSKYSLDKVSDIIEGGSNRQESVIKGLSMLKAEEENVLIHDGARPLVGAAAIEGVVEALSSFDAAVCAVKVNDTVKQCNVEGVIEKTVDRSNLYLAQTPQGVNVKKYKAAIETLATENFTDDTSIMEQAGYTVKITKGSNRNIKITTKEDLMVAEMFIRGEEE